MNNSQNVSKAEWLCAALIDFLPIAILVQIPGIAYNIATIISYCTRDPECRSWHSPSMSNNVSTIAMALSALYLLLKDTFGLSLGKRIMGIKLQKGGNDASMFLCLLRNLILALFCIRCFILIINPQTTSFFLRSLFVNLFFVYCVAELLCVNFTNRTIGDTICQLQMVRRENYVPTKVNDRTFCIIAIIVLFALTKDVFMPRAYLLRRLYFSSVYLVPALVKSVVYSFLLFKLIKPKAFRWTAIILVVLIECGIALKYVLEEIGCR